MTFAPTEEDFITKWDSHNEFSFFENEDAEIFTYGHMDPQDLVSEVKLYDAVCGGLLTDGDEGYDDLIQYVRHTWAVIVTEEVDDEWRFQYGDKYEGEEGAFPLTVLDRG